jgi:hypothetical protein
MPRDVQDQKPVRRRLNAKQKRALKAADVRLFVQKYGHGGRRNFTNNRDYDRELERAIQRMSPEELDRLLREDEE